MNPVLIKPSGERHSQVLVMGTPLRRRRRARRYQDLKPVLREAVLDALADLRARFDVVMCEGAGSPAEINLREGDLANMGLARAAGLPVVLVGDIDRGGVFASLYGTLALLGPTTRRSSRASSSTSSAATRRILAPGLEQLRRAHRPPDARRAAVAGRAVARRRGLAGARGAAAERPAAPAATRSTSPSSACAGSATSPTSTRSPPSPGSACASRARRPTSSAPTSSSCPARRRRSRTSSGCAPTASTARCPPRAAGARCSASAAATRCSASAIEDEVESRRRRVAGLGLLPVRTRFARRQAAAPRRRHRGWRRAPATGYEIRHGPSTPRRRGDDRRRQREGEGCAVGAVLGTSWHGLLEGDAVRRGLLAWVAARRGRRWLAGTEPFAARSASATSTVSGELIEENVTRRAGGLDRGRRRRGWVVIGFGGRRPLALARFAAGHRGEAVPARGRRSLTRLALAAGPGMPAISQRPSTRGHSRRGLLTLPR